MEIIDRVVITFLLMGAILKPTTADALWLVSVLIVFILWQGMVMFIDKYIKPVNG